MNVLPYLLFTVTFQFTTSFSISVFWETGKKQHNYLMKKKKGSASAVVSPKPDNSVIRALEVNCLSLQGKRIVHEHKFKYFNIACIQRVDINWLASNS